jgi:hypothetical protein
VGAILRDCARAAQRDLPQPNERVAAWRRWLILLRAISHGAQHAVLRRVLHTSLDPRIDQNSCRISSYCHGAAPFTL